MKSIGREQGEQGDVVKAPVKVGMDRGVKVPCMVKASDQPWPRVMRRPLVRVAAKR